MGMITSRLQGRSGVAHRCGSASTRVDDVAGGELADGPPELRHPHRGRARASIPSAPRRDETSSVMGSSGRQLGLQRLRPRHAEHGGSDREPRLVRGARASSAWNRSGLPRTSAWTAGSFGMGRTARWRVPLGRAHAMASIQVVTARSRAARPGRRSARSASRIATRSSPPRPEVADVVGPAHQDLTVGREARRDRRVRVDGPARRSSRRDPLLHALRDRPRRRPKSRRTADRAPSRRLAHDARDHPLLRAKQRRRRPRTPRDCRTRGTRPRCP